MKGIISLGEALIDFIPLDADNLSYAKNPGGAPANVAVGVSKLGAKSTFVGKVGNDILGSFLKEVLIKEKVSVEHMILTDEARTGVVFVNLDKNGERSFSFYINPSADRFLKQEELDQDLFKENKILHFGSISLISEPARSATIKAVEYAKEKNMLISYDPNLRLGLWNSEDEARNQIQSMLSKADILKISEEELEFITAEKGILKGLEALKQYEIPLILVTLGDKGAYYYHNDTLKLVEPIKVQTVDTTGAGDAFVSGFLYNINEYDGSIEEMDEEFLTNMLRFANICGALAASQKGAMSALPTLEKVNEILNK